MGILWVSTDWTYVLWNLFCNQGFSLYIYKLRAYKSVKKKIKQSMIWLENQKF